MEQPSGQVCLFVHCLDTQTNGGKKFVLFCSSDATLGSLSQAIESQHKKLYPSDKPIKIERLKIGYEGTQFDLDFDWRVGNVFANKSIVYAEQGERNLSPSNVQPKRKRTIAEPKKEQSPRKKPRPSNEEAPQNEARQANEKGGAVRTTVVNEVGETKRDGRKEISVIKPAVDVDKRETKQVKEGVQSEVTAHRGLSEVKTHEEKVNKPKGKLASDVMATPTSTTTNEASNKPNPQQTSNEAKQKEVQKHIDPKHPSDKNEPKPVIHRANNNPTPQKPAPQAQKKAKPPSSDSEDSESSDSDSDIADSPSLVVPPSKLPPGHATKATKTDKPHATLPAFLSTKLNTSWPK